VTLLVRFVRDRRRSFLGWSVAAVLLILMTVVFYPTIRDQPSITDAVKAMPDALKATFGLDDAVPLSSPEGYLQGRLFALTLPVALVIFAISLGARAIGGSEEDGDLELLLAHPVSRTRVALERGAAVAALVVGLGVVFTALLFALAPPFGALDGIPIGRVVAACAGAVTLALAHGAVAFTTGALTGRRSTAVAVGTAVAAGGYLLQGLLAAARSPDAARFLSPWHWYLRHNMLVEGVDPVAFLLPLAAVLVLAVVAVVGFGRRDLR
jgi:ABC-2 type transport system permease protein